MLFLNKIGGESNMCTSSFKHHKTAKTSGEINSWTINKQNDTWMFNTFQQTSVNIRSKSWCMLLGSIWVCLNMCYTMVYPQNGSLKRENGLQTCSEPPVFFPPQHVQTKPCIEPATGTFSALEVIWDPLAHLLKISHRSRWEKNMKQHGQLQRNWSNKPSTWDMGYGPWVWVKTPWYLDCHSLNQQLFIWC